MAPNCHDDADGGTDDDGLSFDLNDPKLPTKISPRSPYSELSGHQKIAVSLARLWNSIETRRGRELRETQPPQRISDVAEVSDAAERYLSYLRRIGFLEERTIAGKKINWAPTRDAQYYIEDVLEHTALHLDETAIPVTVCGTDPVDVGLVGDSPSSLAHRAGVARLRGLADQAGWDIGMYCSPNPPVDFRLKPPEIGWIESEVWGRNHNQEQWIKKWELLLDQNRPVLQVFRNSKHLAQVLATLNEHDMIDLPSDRSTLLDYSLSHLRSRLRRYWGTTHGEICGGDVTTLHNLYHTDPDELLSNFKDMTKEAGVFIS